MRHWLQLGTRNWRTKPARTGLAVLAVALGVAVVVWVTCCFESVRRSMNETVLAWIGRSHVVVQHVEGRWAFFDEQVEHDISRVAGVLRTTTRTREFVEIAVAADGKGPPDPTVGFERIEVTGVRPDREHAFRSYKLGDGHFLTSEGRNEVVAERLLADTIGFGVGDWLWVRYVRPSHSAMRVKVVGLLERRRASANQPPMIWMRLPEVQSLCRFQGKIKAVDVILEDASMTGIRRAASEIEELVQARNASHVDSDDAEVLKVSTTEAQYKQLGAAQALLQFIMMLLSCVVLLTAFFIILATMNMGVMERIRELGLLRCIGVTRWQVCLQVLTETLPIGVIGVVVGVPLGFLLQWVTILAVPEYVGDMVVNRWGLGMAVFGGLATALLGALAPAVRAMAVSPVEATRPQAGERRVSLVWFTTAGGILLILLHEALKRSMSSAAVDNLGPLAVASVLALYLGFASLTPLVVILLGRVAVRIASVALGLRSQLVGDEIHKAPFRSAAICCGLMVGLSLIVGLVVWGESVKRGWQFPKEFPDAMLYSYDNIDLDVARSLRDTEGVKEFSVADDFSFSLNKPSRLNLFRVFDKFSVKFSRFLAIDPLESERVVKLIFIEGERADAFARLERGGHILVTREFSHARNKHVGDELTIWVGEREASFEVAGVIASPGLDIAISFFNADVYFQTYAVGAIIGSLADAERYFGRSYGKLFLFNFDFDEGEQQNTAGPVETWGGQTQTTDSGRTTFALGPGPVKGDGPEERVVNRMLKRLGFPSKAFVTARQLKLQIESSIDSVTLLLSAIPLVGMIVAALGVANLMTANVASRAHEIAVLRAVGTTRSQVARIVVAEAVILGLLGSLVGVALGVYLGQTSNTMTRLLTGSAPDLTIPWRLVSAGAGLATLLCLLAALLPARYASRSNIVSALSAS
ncbi:MAG: ABC transporter permease [Planctomycetota bacterium]|nr:ABC transporter permease [Planctomycetota bacterium]